MSSIKTKTTREHFNILIIYLFVFSVIFLSGCTVFNGYPERVTSPEKDIEQLTPEINAGKVIKCFNNPTVLCRNNIISARMYAIDIKFSQFEENLYQDSLKGEFSSTLATLGLTSAATIASGGTSRVFSGMASFLIGSREAFQKEVLAQRTIIAIHTSMRATRAQLAVQIREAMNQSIDKYPVGSGLSDVDKYYSAGTVVGALVGITQTIGSVAQKAEKDLQEISYKEDPFAEKFMLSVCRGDPDCNNPDTTKFPAIRACWPEAGVPKDTFMDQFIIENRFSKQRSLVAACMKL